jgi:hypothetical protein
MINRTKVDSRVNPAVPAMKALTIGAMANFDFNPGGSVPRPGMNGQKLDI